MPIESTYLFELLPPIGKGPTKESVRVKRFGLQTDAVDYAKSMVARHCLSAVTISRLTSDAMRIHVGEYPLGASERYREVVLKESQRTRASQVHG